MFQVAHIDLPFDLDRDEVNQGNFPHAANKLIGIIIDKDFNKLTGNFGRKIRFPVPTINNATINILGDRKFVPTISDVCRMINRFKPMFNDRFSRLIFPFFCG